MNCVILQPSYIPWRGYFHQIHKADLFVFLDDVPYDTRGWRNRNRIQMVNGPLWLTIPVLSKHARSNRKLISSIEICWDRPWNERHMKTLRNAYGRAPFFKRYAPMLEKIYSCRPRFLADFTIDTNIAISKSLGIERTRFVRSSELGITGRKTDHLVGILQELNATHYISGPSAKTYLDEEKLKMMGITVEYMIYDYPEYEQYYPPFEPNLSILDLLFMQGPKASLYIWKSDPIKN